MFDSNEHMDEPLLSDDQPSWVTMGNVDDDKNSDEPWDRPDESPLRKSNSGEDRIVDDLPKIILFMRLGNIGAAALLIFGSVRRIFCFNRCTLKHDVHLVFIFFIFCFQRMFR